MSMEGGEQAQLATMSAWGQGGCLPREVTEVSSQSLTHSWMPRLVRGDRLDVKSARSPPLRGRAAQDFPAKAARA